MRFFWILCAPEVYGSGTPNSLQTIETTNTNDLSKAVAPKAQAAEEAPAAAKAWVSFFDSKAGQAAVDAYAAAWAKREKEARFRKWIGTPWWNMIGTSRTDSVGSRKKSVRKY